MHGNVGADELPGIGHRYRIDCHDGGVLTIVVHNSGRRDVYVLPPEGETPSSVSFDEGTARTVAGILAGDSAATPEAGRMEEIMGDLVIEWVSLTPGSRGIGRSLAELAVNSMTGVTVMTILRGKAAIHEPAGSEVLQPGDRLVIAGRRDNVPAFRRLVSGS